MYAQAREVAGGTDERLFEDYFDAQLDMLQQLKPLVVGHFDLIRLKSDDPNGSLTRWPGVWAKIRRNLEFVASYGGMLELNSAALRKGMSEPYPKAEICKVDPILHLSYTLLAMAAALTFFLSGIPSHERTFLPVRRQPRRAPGWAELPPGPRFHRPGRHIDDTLSRLVDCRGDRDGQSIPSHPDPVDFCCGAEEVAVLVVKKSKSYRRNDVSLV